MYRLKSTLIYTAVFMYSCAYAMGAGCWGNMHIRGTSAWICAAIARVLINTAIIVPPPTAEAENPTEEVVAMDNVSNEPLQDAPPMDRPTARLHWGIERNEVEFVRTVIAEGADVNMWLYRDEYQVRPLMRAAELGHKEIVRMLIEAGAKIDAEDIRGQTAYWKAYLKKHRAIMDLLKEKGATTEYKVLSARMSSKLGAYLAKSLEPRP